nr:platelet glycoprotein Ib alpha chain-like [Ipomoea batatas]
MVGFDCLFDFANPTTEPDFAKNITTKNNGGHPIRHGIGKCSIGGWLGIGISSAVTSVDGVGVPINCETTASISILANQLSSSSPCVSAGCGSVEGGTIEDGAVEDGAVEEDESLSKTTSVRREMADTVVEFDEIMAEIGNTRDEGEIIKTTFGNIAEMINVVSSSQHAPEESLLDDDDIFNQPSFLEAVSALEQAFLQTTKNYLTQPPRSHSPQQILTPSFDLIMFSTPTPQA